MDGGATNNFWRNSIGDNKRKALSTALVQIEKQFGKGAVMRMGDVSAVRGIEVISTGSLGLDVALGIGGLPRGRVVEIYGTVLVYLSNDSNDGAYVAV
jgi:RecA/RadA recombinase